MATIRGHQAGIKFFENGTPVGIVDITRFEVSQEASFQRSKYIGNPIPEGDVSYSGFSGSADLEIRDPKSEEFIDAMINNNLAGVGVSDYSLTVQEFYPNGQTRTWAYFDVQWKMSASYGSLEDKVTKRLEWQAAGRIPL